jgi:uncharacterized protein
VTLRLLLPPSEAKHPGGRGRPLTDPAASPVLGEARAAVFKALAALLDGPEAAAASALLLPPAAVHGALAADRAVLRAPTTPALSRYAGVLYQGLDASSLTRPERRLAGRAVLVLSGLLGVVRGDEAVPDYRVPSAARLPGVGVLATYWRGVLGAAMPGLLPTAGLVVDLRSTDYAAMWRPRADLAERVVTVKIVSPLPRGGQGVVSAASKHGKGRLVRAVVQRLAAGAAVATADDLLAAWSVAGGSDGTVELAPGGGRHLLLRTATSTLPG